MRRYTTRDGEERLWYDDLEIEETMRAELGRAGLAPTVEGPAVDVERFVERYLRCDQIPSASPVSEILPDRPTSAQAAAGGFLGGAAVGALVSKLLREPKRKRRRKR